MTYKVVRLTSSDGVDTYGFGVLDVDQNHPAESILFQPTFETEFEAELFVKTYTHSPLYTSVIVKEAVRNRFGDRIPAGSEAKRFAVSIMKGSMAGHGELIEYPSCRDCDGLLADPQETVTGRCVACQETVELMLPRID